MADWGFVRTCAETVEHKQTARMKIKQEVRFISDLRQMSSVEVDEAAPG
jgi:hypothetical protein